MRRFAALALLASLVACSSEVTDADVPWQQYAPEVRERVTDAVESGDCGAMGEEFLSASEGSDAHRAKHGEGNGDLMAYISDSMDAVGCE